MSECHWKLIKGNRNYTQGIILKTPNRIISGSKGGVSVESGKDEEWSMWLVWLDESPETGRYTRQWSPGNVYDGERELYVKK